MPATEWARVSSEEPARVEELIGEFSTDVLGNHNVAVDLPRTP